MTKDEELAFDLALEALEVNNQAWKSLADSGDAGFWEAEEQPFYELSVKAITAIKQARSAPTSAEYAMGYAEGFNDGCKPTPVPDPDYWPGTKPVQEPVAHCEAGPNYCQQCHKESLPTYGSEEVRKLREVIKSQANIISSYESNYGKTSVNLLHGRERELLSWVSDSVVQVTPASQPAPVQEPVWIRPDDLQKAQRAPFLCRVEPNKRDDFVPLYTTPPAAQRQWVGLTDEEKRQIFEREDYQGWLDYINAIEAKLKEKNT